MRFIIVIYLAGLFIDLFRLKDSLQKGWFKDKKIAGFQSQGFISGSTALLMSVAYQEDIPREKLAELRLSLGVLSWPVEHLGMSESRKGTCLKQCQKCHVDMNGDMLDAQGVCLHCKAEAGEEQQKNQKVMRDSVTKNVNEIMETEPAYSEFISCDRSGRRNAIADLQGDAAALQLEKLVSTMDIALAEEENQVEDDDTEKEPRMTPKSQDSSPTL